MIKCEHYICKTLQENCYFASKVLEACTQAIQSVDTDCCISDLYLEISSITDDILEKDAFPVMRVSNDRNAFFTSEKPRKNIMHGRVKMYVMR